MRLSAQLPRVRRLASAVGWTTFDQGLFTLSNLVVTLAVGRSGGAEALGVFAVAFAVYLLVLGCTRSLVSEPLLTTAEAGRAAEPPSVTLVALFSTACGLIVGVPAAMLDRTELVVVAAALPLLTVQDLLRYQAFRRDQAWAAALLDGGWLAGAMLAWPVITATGSPTVAVACWAGGAAFGMAIGWPVARPRPGSAPAALRWWRAELRPVAGPLLLDSVIVGVSTQAVVFVLAWLASDADLGVLRAGQVYFGPVLLLLTALGLPLVPRLAQRPGAASARNAAWMATAMAAVTALCCTAIILAAPMLHRLLFADAIDVPRTLLVPLALQAVLAAGAGGLAVVAKARRRTVLIARSRLTSSVGGVVLVVAGTALYGLPGAVWAGAAQGGLYCAELAVRILRDRYRPNHEAAFKAMGATHA